MAPMIMSRVSDVAIKIFMGFGLIVFCLTIVLVMMTMWKMPVHQFNLWKLGRNFQEIDPYHPLDSKLLGKVYNLGGVFSGASYSCDYFVGEIRSTKYSKENVRQLYSGLFVDTSDGVGRIPVAVRFFDEEDFFDSYPWYKWRAKLRQSFGTPAKLDDVYAVFISQKSRPPYGDIRCR